MKIIVTITLIFLSSKALAQFDDKFYYPKKKWEPIHDSIQFEEINFSIGESQNVNGILLEPEADFKQNILFFHGSGGNVSTYLFMMRPLTKIGYRVMMIDVRGYGKSDGKPTHIGIAEDAPKIYNWLIQQEKFKDEKLIVYGASMGTQVATNLTSKLKTNISLLILDGSMTSFTDIALVSAPNFQKNMIKQYVTSPYTAKEDIKKVSCPVLIIHSEGDEDVPFAQGKSIFELANEPKAIYKYKGKHLEATTLYPSIVDEKIQNLLKLVEDN